MELSLEAPPPTTEQQSTTEVAPPPPTQESLMSLAPCNESTALPACNNEDTNDPVASVTCPSTEPAPPSLNAEEDVDLVANPVPPPPNPTDVAVATENAANMDCSEETPSARQDANVINQDGTDTDTIQSSCSKKRKRCGLRDTLATPIPDLNDAPIPDDQKQAFINDLMRIYCEQSSDTWAEHRESLLELLERTGSGINFWYWLCNLDLLDLDAETSECFVASMNQVFERYGRKERLISPCKFTYNADLIYEYSDFFWGKNPIGSSTKKPNTATNEVRPVDKGQQQQQGEDTTVVFSEIPNVDGTTKNMTCNDDGNDRVCAGGNDGEPCAKRARCEQQYESVQ